MLTGQENSKFADRTRKLEICSQKEKTHNMWNQLESREKLPGQKSRDYSVEQMKILESKL